MKATVITDASFCSETRAAEWAAWITLDNGNRIKRAKQSMKSVRDKK
jgi:hypothetical protein